MGNCLLGSGTIYHGKLSVELWDPLPWEIVCWVHGPFTMWNWLLQMIKSEM